MSQQASVWLVIVAALGAANLPFLNQRLLGVWRLARGKSFGLCLLELVVLYFVVGGLAFLLEQRVGRVAQQNWEFYAITATLFATFAFPGFVWRYLVKHG